MTFGGSTCTTITSDVKLGETFVFDMIKTDQYTLVDYDNVFDHLFLTNGTSVHNNYNNFEMRMFNVFS